MTFSAVGSNLTVHAGTISITPNTVGNLIMLAVGNLSNNTVTATALTATNITWTLIGHHAGTAVACDIAVFIGQVTSTSAAVTTPTWSGTTPANINLDGHEFSSSVGSWHTDTSANVEGSSDATAWPGPASAGAGELYFGYAGNATTATAGSTSGYTFVVDAATQNGWCYNPSYTTSTKPVWGDTNGVSGFAVLISDASTSTGGPAGYAQPGPAWLNRFRQGQRRPVTPVFSPPINGQVQPLATRQPRRYPSRVVWRTTTQTRGPSGTIQALTAQPHQRPLSQRNRARISAADGLPLVPGPYSDSPDIMGGVGAGLGLFTYHTGGQIQTVQSAGTVIQRVATQRNRARVGNQGLVADFIAGPQPPPVVIYASPTFMAIMHRTGGMAVPTILTQTITTSIVQR